MNLAFLDLNAAHAEIQRELDAVWAEVRRSGRFVGGPHVDRFEAEWARYCARGHCVGVSDGTAALELSLVALGIGAGDEVILPANTFFATAEAVVNVGATPVFIDVDPATLLMTAAGVDGACTPRTAAIIAVHLYGQAVDMDAIGRVARNRGLAVIEDAAQAHGATWRGRRVGGFGDVACFSFYPGKNLGAFGDAGAVVTDDPLLAERIRSLGNHGRLASAPERHVVVGRNCRLDALQAAILSVKLTRLELWNEARASAAEAYATLLAGLPVRRVELAPGASSSHHLFVVEVPHRDEVRQRLADQGIATGVHYPIPCHLQPAFAGTPMPSLPICERAAKRVLSLPMHAHLTLADVRGVVAALARTLDDRPAAMTAAA